jgi:hypothetical protein
MVESTLKLPGWEGVGTYVDVDVDGIDGIPSDSER